MFTGIIEETGTVTAIQPRADGIRLAVYARRCGLGVKIGDSIAVNGCCLTAVKLGRSRGGRQLEFDLLQETWKRTNLQFATVGASVNLERSLRASDRLGGHFVSGHIDGMGRIARWEPVGEDWFLEIEAAPSLLRYAVFKGSIAIDGISLTVAAVSRKSLQIWIIPHTRQVTALRDRRPGDAVNIETDILAKYVERLIGDGRKTGRKSGVRRR